MKRFTLFFLVLSVTAVCIGCGASDDVHTMDGDYIVLEETGDLHDYVNNKVAFECTTSSPRMVMQHMVGAVLSPDGERMRYIYIETDSGQLTLYVDDDRDYGYESRIAVKGTVGEVSGAGKGGGTHRELYVAADEVSIIEMGKGADEMPVLIEEPDIPVTPDEPRTDSLSGSEKRYALVAADASLGDYIGKKVSLTCATPEEGRVSQHMMAHFPPDEEERVSFAIITEQAGEILAYVWKADAGFLDEIGNEAKLEINGTVGEISGAGKGGGTHSELYIIVDNVIVVDKGATPSEEVPEEE